MSKKVVALKYVFFVHNACMHCLSEICPENSISADKADAKQQDI